MEAIEIIKRFGKPSNTLNGLKSKPLMRLPYGFIKFTLPELLEADSLQAVQAVMQFSHAEFNIANATGNEIIAFLLWINAQLERIAAIEKIFLSSEPEPELIAAGISRLDEHGPAYANVDGLAEGSVLKHEKINALPYCVIYKKLKYDKTKTEVEKEYLRIMEEKAKRK